MKYYTVLLLRPDYLANPYGTDTYMATIRAPSVHEAELSAQIEAYTVDGGEPHEGSFPDDYAVLAVIIGNHTDIKTP
jgi:hypothetical protein